MEVSENSGNWFYLRGGQPINPSERLVEIIAVGDLMLGRDGKTLRDPFRYVAREITLADFSIGNFEGAMKAPFFSCRTDEEISETDRIELNVSSETASDLQRAGFDLVSLANNHALDCGREGLRSTISALNSAGIQVVGAGSTIEAAENSLVTNIHGVKLAFLSVNAVDDAGEFTNGDKLPNMEIARLDGNRIIKSIEAANSKADVVFLLVHWGDEYMPKSGALQQEAAKRYLDSGADVVIGSHPHVIQELQIADGKDGEGKRDNCV